jgi:hypothetical protein
MFAVVILGIGFILVAAIFPVAIQQSQATNEESLAASAAREAATAIASVSSSVVNPDYTSTPPGINPLPGTFLVPTFPLFPPTVKNYAPGTYNTPPTATQTGTLSVAPPAIVVPFTGAQWEAIKGNTILPCDPRISYTAFYSRENGASVMRLIVVALYSRQHPVYNPSVDLSTTTSIVSATTGRNFVTVTGINQPTTICNDQATFSGGGVAEGYTVATNTNVATGQTTGLPTGRYYHVGRLINGTTYELDPGNNMSLTAGAGGLWGTAGGLADKQLVGNPVTVLPPSTLQATVAYAEISEVPDRTGGRIQLVTSPTNLAPPAAAETGAFVIVADDYPYNPILAGPIYTLPPNVLPQQPPPIAASKTPNSFTVGQVNGRIFRLGTPILEDYEVGIIYPPGTYDLDPQYGMRPIPSAAGVYPESPDTVPCQYLQNLSPVYQPQFQKFFAKVYIIGMARDDSGVYNKAAQDIGVYSTLVPVQ